MQILDFWLGATYVFGVSYGLFVGRVIGLNNLCLARFMFFFFFLMVNERCGLTVEEKSEL